MILTVMATTGHELVGTATAAERLGVSVTTLHRYVAEGALQPIRFTPRARLRFRPSDLEQLLTSGGPVATVEALEPGQDAGVASPGRPTGPPETDTQEVTA